MRYRVLFLDFYGTLVAEDDAIISSICSHFSGATDDSGRTFGNRWSQIFAESCLSSFSGTFQTQREIELSSLSSAMSECAISADPVKTSEELYEYWRRPPAFSEADECLSSCPLPICIVSNVDTDDILSAAGTHGWSFNNLITSEITKAYKPRSEIFEAALALMGVDPAAVLHVGDSLSSDIRGATAVGIDTAWINRTGRTLPEDHVRPTFEFKDLLGVSQLLQSGRTRRSS